MTLRHFVGCVGNFQYIVAMYGFHDGRATVLSLLKDLIGTDIANDAVVCRVTDVYEENGHMYAEIETTNDRVAGQMITLNFQLVTPVAMPSPLTLTTAFALRRSSALPGSKPIVLKLESA